MKKIMLVLAVLIAVVGCENDGEKVADKMNTEGSSAQTLAKQGLDEYQQASYSPSLTDMSLEELDANRALYVSSRTHLSEARAKYQHILDMERDNKDSVKLIGKQSVIDAIAAIDSVLTGIDIRIQNIDATKKARLYEAPADQSAAS